ncbi:Crp/Fnr family transcriptional regulator [Dethiobacter alkaliphilus]|uniref:Crp/Fnr family transcriptional regulator n=1 Tax=Dethiobacter alkaliphilus TaxID=427926 RepID=UPI0022267DB6|nr:Crp/Fnr family transcriptional regulator [Dethiobacter alkaliphilus]MCW3490190.1 Crp/Fnr family transcriptional regulator [Dethiobacter alkaliphilus]
MAMIDKYFSVLAANHLFNHFTAGELEKLFCSINYKVEKYKKGAVIHFQNEVCRTMDVVLEGRVSVQKIEENGNVLTVNVFSPGDTLGVSLIFAGSNLYPMSVLAETDAVILHLSKDSIIQLTQSSVRFMSELLTAISDRALVLTDKINTISLKSIRQRIIEYLRYEYYLQNSTVIRLGMSKKEWAERMGIQRTSLSRELNKMKKDGLLEYDSRTITLKSLEII